MGIDPEFLPRIFNRLTQEDSSTTRSHAGLGLGLAIVRHLVDAHGGVVWAESAGTGRGATFHATFPLLPLALRPFTGGNQAIARTPEVLRPPHETRSDILANRRILVVEDDGGIREALAEMLTGVGASVTTAESAAEGLEAFARVRPDLVVCDLAMPVEDGYAFIRKVRALPATNGRDTPALALTALAGDADRRRALSDGFQTFMVKPVDAIALTTTITELLERARGKDVQASSGHAGGPGPG